MPGKDFIKAQAKPFFPACTNWLVSNHMDDSYPKWKIEEVIYVPKITTSSHKMQTHKWDLKVITCESGR